MPGPRPTPDHVKATRRTLRRDRVQHIADVAAGAVEPPVGLPLEAILVWTELAPPLIASGMLKPVDALAFGQFCTMTAHLQQLWPMNEAPPATYVGQWRLLGEQFGCMGEKSRVLGRKRPEPETNPFARNGTRPPATGGAVRKFQPQAA